MTREPVTKKLIIGLVAVGAVMALRPLVKRMMQEMRDQCEQMMGQFAARTETTGQATRSADAMRQKMREHCEQMAAQHEERSEPAATA